MEKNLTWVVGDIHGCYKELLELETALSKRCKEKGCGFFLVSTGDLVDRGIESAKVVQHFMDGTQAGTHACVLGNHESEFLLNLFVQNPYAWGECALPPFIRTLDDLLKKRDRFHAYGTKAELAIFRKLLWLNQGGAETLLSYGFEPSDPSTWILPAEHLDFLCSLPLVWQDSQCVVTHALATHRALKQLENSTSELSREDLLDAADTLLWERQIPEAAPHEKKWHISGHTPLKEVKTETSLKLIQIDTGCYKGGSLTAFCPELQEIVSVPGSR